MEPKPTPWSDLDARLRGYFRRRVSDAALADDLVQDTMSRVLDGVPKLRDADAIVPWAYRLAQSTWVDHLRRSRPSVPLPETLVAEEASEDLELTREVASWLRPMLASLSARDREVLELSDVQGVAQVEIARRLGLSPSGARTRVQRARRKLRAALEACCLVERDSHGNVLGYEPRASCCGGSDGCG